MRVVVRKKAKAVAVEAVPFPDQVPERGWKEKNRDVILAALKEAKIDEVTARYDGSGDSGGIEEVEAWRKKGKSGDFVQLPGRKVHIVRRKGEWDEQAGGWVSKFSTEVVELKHAIENMIYDWTEENHPGWENNDGAYGEVTFKVKEGTIEFTHNTRIIQIETHEETV